jgi:hypothetical protein
MDTDEEGINLGYICVHLCPICGYYSFLHVVESGKN